MNYIFIDTSFFERENFLRGHKIKKLGEFSSKGFVKVKITAIVYEEILKRFEIRLTEAKALLNKIDKQVSTESKILKNIDSYNAYFPFTKVNVSSDLRDLKERLDQYLAESEVEIVNMDLVDLNDVFYRYFNSQPPFGSKKKCEFPDACCLSIISKYSEQNDGQCFVLTEDGDWKSFIETDENIELIPDASEFIDAIIQKNSEEGEIAIIEKLIDTKYIEVEKVFKECELDIFSESLVDKVIDHSLHLELNYNQAAINSFNVEKHFISEFDDSNLTVEFKVKIEAIIELDYIDLSKAVYDKEDGTYYNATSFSVEHFYNVQMNMYVDFEIIKSDVRPTTLKMLTIDSVNVIEAEVDYDKSSLIEESTIFQF